MYTSIPAMHVSSRSHAKGGGTIFIQSRTGSPAPTGKFDVRIDVAFDPAVNDYPVLTNLTIRADLTDGQNGIFTATSIELINSYGKHNPTIYLTGRCKYDGQTATHAKGFKYWLMIANNKAGPNKAHLMWLALRSLITKGIGLPMVLVRCSQEILKWRQTKSVAGYATRQWRAELCNVLYIYPYLPSCST
ncbi:hypothetical protein EXU57_18120 [Segetibacter sp. 3557_3]|uniref:hypothetical protein n=1 Tax=Segetibacter sp. 3557_3 TaxID=2547429 RepID=UPI001058B7B1|nr:hypothetical protein [Segetibacter sp. 3557_3]TDH22982.1 hypothetical protein EXU57_18120 [Segetibacter sp. 3557_3]